MDVLGKGGAAVRDDGAVEFAHMGVPHGRGHAAIGDDAGNIEPVDAALAQHPFEPRHVERRVGDLFDRDIGWREHIDELLAPPARREVARLEERPQLLEMRRDDRLAAAAGNEREQCRDDEHAVRASGVNKRRELVRQRGEGGAGLPGAAIGAVGMQKVVLQIDENERGRVQRS